MRALDQGIHRQSGCAPVSAHSLTGSYDDGRALVLQAASGMRAMLSDHWIGQVRGVADYVQQHDHLFVVCSGLSYPTALEAALEDQGSQLHPCGRVCRRRTETWGDRAGGRRDSLRGLCTE